MVAGRSVNNFGNSLGQVALPFAALDLGGSATELGLVVAIAAMANLASVLFGGVLGDRLPRRVLMVFSNLSAGVVQAIVAACFLSGRGSLPLLAVGGALNGALSALGGPSTQAVTRQLLGDQQLRQGLATLRLVMNVCMVIGFGIGGLLVVGVGVGATLMLDAATFVIAALFFTRLQLPAASVQTAGRTRFAVLDDARAGLVEVRSRSWLLTAVVAATVYHFVFGGVQGALGPIVVEQRFDRQAWGLTLAALLVGFVLGGFVMLRWKPKRLMFTGQLWLVLTAALPLAIAWADNRWLLLLGGFAHGFGLEIFSVNWDLSLQQQVPPNLLARVYSVDMFGSFLARPIGLVMVGVFAKQLGSIRWMTIVAIVMVAVAVAPLWVRDLRLLERVSLQPLDAS